MPETASGLAHGAGFVLAIATLHAAGLGLGLLLDSMGKASGSLLVRSLGAWPLSPVLVSWSASFEPIPTEPLNDDGRQGDRPVPFFDLMVTANPHNISCDENLLHVS